MGKRVVLMEEMVDDGDVLLLFFLSVVFWSPYLMSFSSS